MAVLRTNGIGLGRVARAKPDGYTIDLGFISFTLRNFRGSSRLVESARLVS